MTDSAARQVNAQATPESGLTPEELRKFSGADFTREVRYGLVELGVQFTGITWRATETVVEAAIKPLRDEIARLRGLLRPFVEAASVPVVAPNETSKVNAQRRPRNVHAVPQSRWYSTIIASVRSVVENILKQVYKEFFGTEAALSPAPSEAPHFPIALNDSQEQCVKIWAADMKCWATPETVEFNLRTFARKIIGESGQPGAPSEAKPTVTEAAENLLHAMDTCHVCGNLLEVEGGPVYCKDGCTRYCDAHEGEECESISALHQKLRDAMGSEAKPASEEK